MRTWPYRESPANERIGVMVLTWTDDPYGDDIYTEPDGDPNTLANLGPLTPMAGVWQGMIDVARAVADIRLPVDVNVSTWTSPSEPATRAVD